MGIEEYTLVHAVLLLVLFLESIDAPGLPSIGWYFGSKVI